MDDKKKIVLGSEDFLAKGLDDIFLNVNLQKTFKQIKKEKYDNNFDLAEQFRKERNESRSFRIYGIVDSTVIDCDNLPIRVYSDSGLTSQVYATTTNSLGYGDFNVYGKQDGKYIIELDNYQLSDSIWIKIEGNGVNTADQVFEQQLVFYGADGDFIDYGTETVDIGFNGQFATIENDFPFFYNKHWIKKPLQIEEIKTRNVSFERSAYTLIEGNGTDIRVYLNEPSVFGNESVTIDLASSFVETYTDAAPGVDFNTPGTTFPVTLNWSVGEQYKTIPFDSLEDFIVEKSIEIAKFDLTNPVNVTLNNGVVNIPSTTVSIIDQTPKKYVNFNFQKIIQNITPVTNPSSQEESLAPRIPGVELNAFGGRPGAGGIGQFQQNYRFYPNDTFELEIINSGDTTTLPIIPGVTLGEQFFGAGQTITLDIETKYVDHDTLPREQAVFNFKEVSAGNFFVTNVYNSTFFINGVEIGPIRLAAEEFENELQSAFDDIGVDRIFNISRSGPEVTLTAKHPANSVNGWIPSAPGSSLLNPETALQGNDNTPDYPNGRVFEITDQIPFEIRLYANDNNNTVANYLFRINKRGYKSVTVPAQSLAASTSGNDYYLVTPIRDVDAPSLPSNDSSVCNVSTYDFDSNGYYLNGLAFIAANVQGYTDAQAKNERIPAFTPQFRPNPLTSQIINCYDIIEMSKVLS